MTDEQDMQLLTKNEAALKKVNDEIKAIKARQRKRAVEKLLKEGGATDLGVLNKYVLSDESLGSVLESLDVWLRSDKPNVLLLSSAGLPGLSQMEVKRSELNSSSKFCYRVNVTEMLNDSNRFQPLSIKIQQLLNEAKRFSMATDTEVVLFFERFFGTDLLELVPLFEDSLQTYGVRIVGLTKYKTFEPTMSQYSSLLKSFYILSLSQD